MTSRKEYNISTPLFSATILLPATQSVAIRTKSLPFIPIKHSILKLPIKYKFNEISTTNTTIEYL